MTLSELKGGETVFIDANIFLYHFTGASSDCKEFLKRCENGDLFGVTGFTVLAEACHRLMIAEAVKHGVIRPQKPAAQLQKKPQAVKRLSEYAAQIMNMLSWKLKIIYPTEDIFLKSQIYRSQFGLLTNDSFIPVYMEAANTEKIATNDRAFERVIPLRLYSPSDIK